MRTFILGLSFVTGARVTATDLPELLGNLEYNLVKNTKARCKHEPRVKELSWGVDLEKNFPRSLCQFDYILAADVVYHHPYLHELLLTFDHLCKENTTIIWAMRFRQEKENQFVETFQKLFKLEVILDFPSLNITLFKAKRRHRVQGSPTTASWLLASLLTTIRISQGYFSLVDAGIFKLCLVEFWGSKKLFHAFCRGLKHHKDILSANNNNTKSLYNAFWEQSA